MLRKSIQLMLAAFGAATLAGCATPGAPQPPSLELPRPPDDLRATRQGDTVTLTWTQPTETTDRARIRHIGSLNICRIAQASLSDAPPQAPRFFDTCTQAMASGFAAVTRKPLPEPTAICESPPDQTNFLWLLEYHAGRKTAVICDKLPADLERREPVGVANYAVQIENDHGRAAGFSNIARVPLAPAPAPPGDLRAEATRRGILISWTPATSPAAPPVGLAGYRLERTGADRQKQGAGTDQKSGPLASASNKNSELLMIAADSPSNGHFLDTAFEWGKPYRYRVAPVVRVQSPTGETLAEVQGAWSAPQEITPKDVFPPAQPGGVQAIYTESGTQHYIDLTWLPNQEADLAGYYIYRRSGNAPAERLNRDLLKSPAFRDTNVQPGMTYFYSVSAVDLRGNESPRSTEATESAPK